MGRDMSDEAEAAPYRLAHSPSHLLHRAEQMAADRFSQLVEGAITLRQFTVLAALAQRPGMSQSELVSETGIDRSTIAEMLARMEKRAWISRAAHALDQRAQSVRLTPAGELMLRSAAKHARAADAAILDALPRAKRKSFVNLLTRLSDYAAEAAEKAARAAKRKSKRKAKTRGKARKPKRKSPEPQP